jgi:hypothetical protein
LNLLYKREDKTNFYIIFLLFFSFFSYSLFVNIQARQRGGFFSDESAYYSITQSIAYDFDLKYTKTDIYRIKKNYGIPQGIFIKKGRDGNLYFSKSFIYPLFAAPFFRIFGVNGFFIFHSILLLIIMIYGYLISFRYYKSKIGIGYILLFIFGSVAWLYFFWITADFFNFSMVFISYLIFFYYKDEEKNIIPLILSAFILGIVTFSKPPNIFLTLPMLYYIVFKKKSFKKFILYSAFYILPAVLLFTVQYSFTGDWNFMGGERKSFYYRFPLEQKNYTFDKLGIKMSSSNYWQRYYITPKIFFLNLIYFFIGRYTGLLIYGLPGLIFLILFLFRRERNSLKHIIILTFFIEIIVYIGMAPDNYFGGAGSLGNRYGLNFFPLLFFLFPEKIDLKKIFYIAAVALLFLAPAFFEPLFYSAYTGELSKTPVLRMFPPEITQISSIPTNINPHAYRKPLVNSKIYILNNNFNGLKEDRGIWMYKEGTIEFILETTKKCDNLKIFLKNNPMKELSFVSIKIGSKKSKLRLSSDEAKNIVLFGIKPSLKLRNYYYYYGKISTTTSAIPFYITKDNRDRRRVSLYFKPVFEKCAE